MLYLWVILQQYWQLLLFPIILYRLFFFDFLFLNNIDDFSCCVKTGIMLNWRSTIRTFWASFHHMEQAIFTISIMAAWKYHKCNNLVFHANSTFTSCCQVFLFIFIFFTHHFKIDRWIFSNRRIIYAALTQSQIVKKWVNFI